MQYTQRALLNRPRSTLALGILFAAATAAAQPQPAGSVLAVRHWSLGNVTRVAIETSVPCSFRTERVDAPERLFLDIADTQLGLVEKGLHIVKVNDTQVRQIRVAQNQPRITRVVLEMVRPVDYEISQLSNPPRIIIEVRPKGTPAAKPVTENKPAAAPTPAPAPKPAHVPVTPTPAPAVVAEAPVPKSETARPGPRVPEGPPPKPAAQLSNGRSTLTRTLGLKLSRVVIDPGHGGHDTGTIGPGGLLEKELVLDVALRLGVLIEQRLGSKVNYTRNDDTFIALQERTEFANRSKADLFLSIHANSSAYKAATGSEVYYLNFTSSKVDMEVAARENAGHGMPMHELSELLRKIALKEKIDESREFADRIQTSLQGTWNKLGAPSRNRGVKKAPFVVLIGAQMPSVLAEVGFISNPRDEVLMKRPDQRQRLAEALYRGIAQYASTLSQFPGGGGQSEN